jgi:hypothetical protein
VEPRGGEEESRLSRSLIDGGISGGQKRARRGGRRSGRVTCPDVSSLSTTYSCTRSPTHFRLQCHGHPLIAVNLHIWMTLGPLSPWLTPHINVSGTVSYRTVLYCIITLTIPGLAGRDRKELPGPGGLALLTKGSLTRRCL